MTPFSATSWLAWALGAAAVVLSVADPLVTLAALIALAWVAVTFSRGGPEGRAYVLLLKIGLAATAIRIVLFSLTGHTGPTTLFTLPTASLPGWLGGFTLGGRVTAEVVAQHASEGLAIAAFLLCFGVFVSVVETYRVIRLLPRFLFEAGLVVGIALSFVPTLLRTTRDVRDAQRLRGHRFRGPGSWRALVAPVLSGALERSLTLAASMETRGYGRAMPGAHRREGRARVAVLTGLLVMAVGGGLVLASLVAAGAGVAAAGAAIVGVALRALSGTVARTRLRHEPETWWDRALAGISVAIFAGAIAARAASAATWYAYPVVRLPAVDPRTLALAVALAAPVPLAALRSWRLRRASRADTLALPAAVELDPVSGGRA